MRAGRLRHRVTIQEKPDPVPQNSFGEEEFEWQDVVTLWAAIEPIRGGEFLEGRHEGAEATTRIVTRYYSGIRPEMRATEGSHAWDILSVINVDERDRELQLMCREVLGALSGD